MRFAGTPAASPSTSTVQYGRLALGALGAVAGPAWAVTGGIPWLAVGAAGLVMAVDAVLRMHSRWERWLPSTMIDITLLGLAAFAGGFGVIVTLLPLAYAAVAVVVHGGLCAATGLPLAYAGLWSAVLASHANDPRFWSASTEPATAALIAQAAFAVLLGGFLIYHRRVALATARYRRQAAEAAERKAAFLRNMSHEIRTPMNGILGMADLLIESELAALHLEQIAIIRSSGFELLALINDLLDLSWLEAGEIEIETVPFQPRDLLSALLEASQPEAAAKGLTLDLFVSSTVPEVIEGDPGRLRQVLSTLVGNAVKFTSEGGVWIRVASRQTEDGVELHAEVQDTGVGMSPDQQQQIYESFTQSDESLTRERGGSGIGLAIAHRLTRLMDGELTVASEPGIGTTFGLTLHFAVPASTPAAPSPRVAVDQARVLLLCEPSSDGSRFAEALRSNGFEVETADSVDEARSRPIDEFDAMVVDLHESLGAVARLRAEGETHPPALVISGAGQRGDAGRARALGVFGYLTRPIGSDDVAAAVRAITAPGFDPDSPLITVHTMREQREAVGVLIADDSPTNRMIAAEALRRRGYSITEVDNGAEAVEAWRRGGFDLVLMDIQMPVMDGLEATRRIRELEVPASRHTPILALTAHALPEDRRRATEAGVDGYLVKPLRIDALVRALQGQLDAVEEGEAWPSPAVVLDEDVLLSQMGGSRAIAAEVVALFLETIPEHTEAIAAAIADNDDEEVQRRAHRLKGELGGIGAAAAHGRAEALDQVARQADWSRIAPAWDDLRLQLETLEVELGRFLAAEAA